MSRARLRLVAWNREDAARLAKVLRGDGYVVNERTPALPQLLSQLASRPPAAIVIDLSRLPSQGRDLGVTLRVRKGTRHLPLVFLGGEAGKVAQIRRLLPDSMYTSEADLLDSVALAIVRPPRAPIVPKSAFAAYEGTPLPKKLGLRSGTNLYLIDAPAGFADRLRPLPDAATIHRADTPGEGMTIWFVRDRRRLHARLPKLAAKLRRGALWVAWPKRASGTVTDLTQVVVRAEGLAVGLVDYKICSIDDTWSALLFRQRSSKRSP